MKQLHVHILEAVDLPRTEFLSFSDLYMVLQISTSSAIQQTNVIEGTQNPIWNQDFHFSLMNQNQAVLCAIVKNKTINNSDPPVSKIEIPLSDIEPYQVIDRWYDLESLVEGQNGGKCKIIIQIAPAGHPAFLPLDPNRGMMMQQCGFPMQVPSGPMVVNIPKK
ncbi:hypothetical protein M9Y10_022030 [Tritrichomonas musculus]|uniref:C2 domain-containing protein n=1 Tax=Tritrichomonas musculus TaxID=1915356 RepID=A0ABR2KRE3_9EUKA